MSHRISSLKSLLDQYIFIFSFMIFLLPDPVLCCVVLCCVVLCCVVLCCVAPSEHNDLFLVVEAEV